MESLISSLDFDADEVMDPTLSDPRLWYGDVGLSMSHTQTQSSAHAHREQLHDSLIDAIMPIGSAASRAPARVRLSG